MAQVRTANARLAGVIAQTGLSHAQIARAFVRVAVESRAPELAGVGRSHVSHWVGGSKPLGRAGLILCETLSRRLRRVVTLEEIGLAGPSSPSSPSCGVAPDWCVDTLSALVDLGRRDVDVDRRRVLRAAAYSVPALVLPGQTWWQQQVTQGRTRTGTGSRAVGRADVEGVRDMVSLFSRIDQRRGGGHGRTAVAQYLTTDVAGALHGRFPSDQVRRDMFSAASELAYVCGWMAFDDAEHAIGQHYFGAAVKLAAEADDRPLAGHVLRAMAHQALELGHRQEALNLAAASMASDRYLVASPRERALFGVVYGRTLVATGQQQAAAKALLRAEDDLAGATAGDEEPTRVFFFGEASLAHETACALRDSGDLDSAGREFRRSVRTRKAASFTRTHAVTLGYLGAVQARQGAIDEACATWSTALEAMDGIQSGRTRQAVLTMRSVLSPLRKRGIRGVADLDARATSYLAATT